MWNKDNNQQDIMKTKLKTLTSVLSLYGLSLSNNILQITFSLILIRLLTPHHFGLFAALFALFNVFTMLIPMGQNALFVRKKGYPIEHLIQIIFVHAIVIITLLESASNIFSFINPHAPQIARILFLALLPSSINLAFMTLATKKLEQYRLFPAWMLETISYGISAILFALNNYGVYSFVYGIVISRIVFLSVALFIYRGEILLKQMIRIRQYITYLKEGFTFSLLFLMGPAFDQADRVVLTRFIPMSGLGLYSVALRYSSLFNNFIFQGMDTVVYPLYSKFADNIERIKRMYYDFTTMAFAMLIPFNSFIFVFSRDIIQRIAGEKWIGAAYLVSILSFLYLVKFVPYFGYQILWARRKERIGLIQLITRGVLFLSVGIALCFKYKVYGFIIAYFVQGFYDSVFYYFMLKNLRSQIHRCAMFIILLFIPVFIVLNVVGKLSNFYAGILAMVVIYLVFSKYIFIPFIERQFNIKITKLFPSLIRGLRNKNE